MIKTLAKSIREYKLSAILAPLIIACEVAVECTIPFVTAQLVRRIEEGSGMDEIIKFGLILVVLAFLSLTCGALAGHFAAVASRSILFNSGVFIRKR